MAASKKLFVRLFTHNIRYATRSPQAGEEAWSVRKSKILNELLFSTRHCPAAFVCLQEVLYHQLQDVLTGLNEDKALLWKDGVREPEWAYIGVGRDDGSRDGEFSPILYRPAFWKLEKSKNVWLSETPDRPSRGWDAACKRILTIGVFQSAAGGPRVLAMNTHLDHVGAKSRHESAKIILREMDSLRQGPERELPVFLAGDFNSERGDGAYQLLAGDNSPLRDFAEAVRRDDRYGDEYTFTGFNDKEPKMTIDFLFLGPKSSQDGGTLEAGYSESAASGWRPVGLSILPNRFDDMIYSSDHRAVVGDAFLHSHTLLSQSTDG
jgi:endonuclease/exonuclease/phosphatase family metal-dependent hydrolase